MRDAFDKHCKKYDAWYDKHKFAFLSELDAIRKVLPRNEKGLEIGVGTGRFASRLGIKYGVDPSENMLKIAKKRGIDVHRAQGERLPFDINNGFRYIGLYGMSYHGALIAIVFASVVFCRKYKLNFWLLADLLAPAVPLGYTFGRLGNFINGELYGRVTTVPWGMYFPLDSMHQLRHPSQLYEALFEGVLLFIILWSMRKKIRIPGGLFSLYLIGYGVIRFFLEFFRQPDQQLGFVVGYLTMGQILCLIMAIEGLILLIKQYKFNLDRRL